MSEEVSAESVAPIVVLGISTGFVYVLNYQIITRAKTEHLIRYGVSVPLPCSGRQLNALGKRLADGEPSDADIALFAQVLDVYQAVLDQVEQRLRELGFQATTRVKTTGTLIDKLQRDPTLKLKSIHDLAGARIVIDGTRHDQDAVRDSIVNAFAGCSKPRSTA